MSQEQTDNKYTRAVSDFVSGLTYDGIPKEVISRTKLLILDALACGLYGARTQWSQILQNALAKEDQAGSCTIWGTNRRLSGPSAALINGTQVQGFELDDAHHRGVVHLGAAVQPALLAIAESRGNL